MLGRSKGAVLYMNGIVCKNNFKFFHYFQMLIQIAFHSSNLYPVITSKLNLTACIVYFFRLQQHLSNNIQGLLEK